MEGKLYELYEAAIAGAASELDRLIRADPDILTKVIAGYEKTDNLNEVIARGAETETPLHVAAQLGHIEFVRKIRNLKKPDFTRVKNSQGRCPLHLASVKGHVEVVAELLEMNPYVCFVRDKDGRTPLHIAAMKGRVDVLKKLAEKKTKAAWVLTDCGQPILHLCANHDQFKALKVIIDCIEDKEPGKLTEFMNLKDDDHNTVLHLLAAKDLDKVNKVLFPEESSKKDLNVDVNAINMQGSTALDVFYRTHGTRSQKKIKYILGDGAKLPRKSYWEWLFERRNEQTSESRDALMVVAILIATVTFEAQMSPPGGVWQEDGNITVPLRGFNRTVSYTAGKSIMPFNAPKNYFWFTSFNTLGFVSSLILILLLASGFTLHRKVSRWALTVTTWIAVLALLLVFAVSYNTLHSDAARQDNVFEMRAAQGASGLVGLGLLVALTLVAYGIRYFWKHFHKGINNYFRRMMKTFLHLFKNSSERASEGRNEMNA